MRHINHNLHTIHAGVTFLLILTGLLLYSQFLRGTLADLHIYLRAVHIVLGIAFTATVLSHCCILAGNRQKLAEQAVHKLLTAVFILLAFVDSMTGLLLFSKVDLQSVLGISTLSLHKGIGVIFSTAVLYHSLYYLFGGKSTSGNREGATLVTNRRVLIRWGAAIAAVLGGGGLIKWITSNSNDFSLEKKKHQFNNCNDMTPQPIPSLGSVPPIGGGYKGEFEVFKVTSEIPCSNSQNWQFRVFGLINQPMTLNWSEFLEIARQVQVSDFYCITGWTVYDVTYEGILLSQLLALAKVKPEAQYVKLYSADGVYTSALRLDQAQMDDVMIAVLMDGKPIPSDLGGPARLIVPQMYAYKGVKWLNAIELIHEPYLGFWEERGYVNDAWVHQPKQ